MPKKYIISSLLFILILTPFQSFSQHVIQIEDSSKVYSIGKQCLILEDKNNHYNGNNIIGSDSFEKSTKNIPVYQTKDYAHWIKFTLQNNTPLNNLYFEIAYANISEIEFYQQKNDHLELIQQTGTKYNFEQRDYYNTNFIFRLPLPSGTAATYYLRVKSWRPILLPMTVQSENSLRKKNNIHDLFIGIYAGILLSILLYNLVLYFFVKDNNYLIYIFYLLLLLLSQLTLEGYLFRYFWPDGPFLNRYVAVTFPALAGIAGVTFAYYFLRIKFYLPKIIKWLICYVALYVIAIIFSYVGLSNISFNLLDFNGSTLAIFLIVIAEVIARKRFRAAYFYLIAWSVFLVGIIIYVLRNFGIIPDNIFTTYVLYIGSAIETILLSIALADKINTYRKEKEIAQEQNIRLLEEKQETARLRAIELTRQVDEKTAQLSASNLSLSTALQQLKETQSQMVQAEKMASLGQLTAGVAHEINNPINFVKSNVAPLKTDIGELQKLIRQYEEVDWKGNADQKLQEIEAFKKSVDMDYVHDEIDQLMKGIEEGANRTIDIVKGLRIFSRLDEGDLKQANVQEGIDSTLVLLRNALPKNIEIVKEYGDVQMIECYPGKLNQVFMNILNNAVYAIKEKNSSPAHEEIIISTYYSDTPGYICIGIKDTGMGIKTEVKEKIFDPFFTTKEVGEGTGLGLSIVFSIIENHKGKIIVNTEYEKGTEFIITLPTVHKTKN